MLFFKATYSFNKGGYLERAEFGHNQGEKTDGSTVFPVMPYGKVAIQSSSTLLTTTHGNYMLTHSDEDFVKLTAADKDLRFKLRKNADYVTLMADGDKDLIISAGFVPSKGRSKKPKAKWSVEPGPEKGWVKLTYTKEKSLKEITVVWLVYKGKLAPESFDDYRFCTGTSLNVKEKPGFVSGEWLTFIAASIRTNSNEELIWTAPMTVLVP